MKKIKYKKLKISNFLSVGNDTIEIDLQKGLNQIDGINSDIPDRKNGVGKTVIPNGFFFALFGETINKIKSEFVRNNVTNKDGLVELQFDVETSQGTNSYTIKRYVKKASKVELFQGDSDITKSSIKETDKYICDLLSTNPNIHRCCDIMTVRDTDPFMEMEAKDKRAFIESIFDIDVFGVMLKDLKKMITETKKDKDVSAAKVSEIQKSLQSLIDQKRILQKQIDERDQVLQKRKDDLNTKINYIKVEIDGIDIQNVEYHQEDIDKLTKAMDDLDIKMSDCQIAMSNNRMQIDAFNDRLKKLSSVKEGVVCDKCMQNIDHTHIDFVEAEKESTNILLKKYEDGLEAHEVELDKFKCWKNKLSNKKHELQLELEQANGDRITLKNLNREHDLLLRSLTELEEDILTSSVSLDSFDENIKKTEERNEEESKTLEELQQKLADYDICKFILGEEGVKSFVVKKLLDLLNNTIEKYLIELGLNVRVKFDEYFEEVITSDGKVFSYKNASGAEKKSLDFACAFSFSDMRRKINQVSSNVEFLDEVLDSGTDTTGLGLIINIIKDRIEKHDLCVYLISHRKEVKDKIDGETIMLEKSGKITRRIS